MPKRLEISNPQHVWINLNLAWAKLQNEIPGLKEVDMCCK